MGWRCTIAVVSVLLVLPKVHVSGLLLKNSTAISSPPPLASPASTHVRLAAKTQASQLPLKTSGSKIVDRDGKHVKLACVNWAGAEQRDGVNGGLQHQRAEDIAGVFADMGFNCIRILWSVWAVQTNPTVDATGRTEGPVRGGTEGDLLAANPELKGKTSLEILDAVVDACASKQLMVVLDNHMSDGEWMGGVSPDDNGMSDGGWRGGVTPDDNGLWWNDRWPESEWLAAHRKIAARYKSQPYVVGAELRNELRPSFVGGKTVQPLWGTGGNELDWHAAAIRGGEAVLEVNPDLLIFVDGLAFATDLSGVEQLPVELSIPHRVVYAAHDYYWPWQPSDYEGLKAALDRQWGYIKTEGKRYTAPVWVGEFGTWHDPKMGTLRTGWFPALLRYLEERDLDFSYWRGDGTESRGATRVFGAEAGFGLLNTTWDGPASGGVLLRMLQAIQAPRGHAEDEAAIREHEPMRPFQEPVGHGHTGERG